MAGARSSRILLESCFRFFNASHNALLSIQMWYRGLLCSSKKCERPVGLVEPL